MKSYAPNDIKNRLVNRLSENSNWKKILQDGAIDSLLTAYAEGLSESDRYYEYLFRERTWDYAQNLSSILGQIAYLGYKVRRKISAIGYIHLSLDSRIHTISGPSELDTLNVNTGANILIPTGTPIVVNSIPFLTSQEVSYTNGTRFLRIPVIQGVSKSVSTFPQASTGNPFEILQVNEAINIEAAVDLVSKRFFNVSANISGFTVNCEEVENIFLANSDQYAYEMMNVLEENENNNKIKLKFGNNVSGVQFPANTIFSVSYLETLGSSGNVLQTNLNEGEFVVSNVNFFFNNFEVLEGGKNLETLEELKIKAPNSFLLEGSIVSEEQYIAAIESIPYVYKANVYNGQFLDPELQELKDGIIFTAINTSGLPPIKETIEADLTQRTRGKKSPLDIYSYVPPDFVNIAINYQADLSKEASISNENLISNLRSLIYNKFNIFNSDFKQGISREEIGIFINQNYPILMNSTLFIEAKENLVTSSFTKSPDSLYFQKVFSFNPSFEELDLLCTYVMKIDIVWSCVDCEYKNRTILLLRNQKFDSENILSKFYFVKVYPYISNIITADYMKDVLLNGDNKSVKEFEVGDPGYYPFDVQFDHTSPLAEDTIFKIRVAYNNFSYIDFEGSSQEELDSNVSISAFAFPVNYSQRTIYPYTDNSILNLLEKDIKIEVK
jgi:hypothetical protein